MRHPLPTLLIAVALTLSGCGKKSAGTLDAEEADNPLVKRGIAALEAKDYAAAERAFRDAIYEDPAMARPYLELGSIYRQFRPNYLNAICCYKQYLNLRPDSEKTPFIRDQIKRLQQKLYDGILEQGGFFRLRAEYDRTRAECARLRHENDRLRRGGVAAPKVAAPAKTVTETIPKKAVTKTPTAPKKRPERFIYTVRRGDTLSKIANKYYGDSGNWDAIYQANKDRMKSPGDLRVGQTLVVPNLER